MKAFLARRSVRITIAVVIILALAYTLLTVLSFQKGV